MVPAVVSGVAFSCDPLTAHPGVVIEACRGLCEALVQGRVRPDRYRLDPRGEIDEMVPAGPGAPLLNEPRIKALGALVRAIADAAAAPQDVEWAFDGRAFHVLQARPVSSLVGEDAASASFAGQLETVLDVGGEPARLAAVRRVLASAFGDRLWEYLRRPPSG